MSFENIEKVYLANDLPLELKDKGHVKVKLASRDIFK